MRDIFKLLMAFAILLFFSCQDWGAWDDPAGNQKNPPAQDTSLKLLAEYNYEENIIGGESFLYDEGETPSIIENDVKGLVLNLDGGYVRYENPLFGAQLTAGASVTFYMNMQSIDLTGALFSFGDAEVLYFTANASFTYKASTFITINDPESTKTNAISAESWHLIGVSFSKNGFSIYIDGKEAYTENNNLGVVSSPNFDYSAIVDAISTAPYFYLGYGSGIQTGKVMVDDVKLYANLLTAKEVLPEGMEEPNPEPVYFNAFDKGAGDSQIIGSGSFIQSTDFGFNGVFKNAVGGMRKNYLLLPSDALSHSANTKEMTIGVWVNAADAGASTDYMWSPLLTAYANAPTTENTSPMFALQYRGLVQINNTGWCNFTDEQNVKGENKLYHDATDWLADKGWHYYAVTITESNVKVYLDGEIANEWLIDGTENGGSVSGLFTNGSDLSYICLGGNQAWNWGDPDPGFMFDDIAIYNKVLSQNQIKEIILNKKLSEPVYINTFDKENTAEIIGSGSFVSDPDDRFGVVFKNATGGMRQNYLLLPDTILSKSDETQEMTISVWVNATHAGASVDYMWSPLFTAYGSAPTDGANTWPLLALQYRGLIQVNCAGWCDFTDAQNVNGVNIMYHNENDWLADKKWHHYTATFTSTSVKVYFDGKLANEWAIDGTDGATVSGLFSNGNDLKYICLGGNQAWSWGDPDPGFMFDDFAVYKYALSPSQIALIMSNK